MQNNDNKALTKKEIRKTLRVAMPLLTSNLIQVISGFSGTVMVTRLGTDAVAASGIVFMTWILVAVVFSFSFLASISILVSQQHGAKNHKAVSILFRQSLYLGLMTAVPATLLMTVMPSIVDSFGILTPAVQHYSDAYYYSLAWSLPGLCIIIALEQYLIGLEQTKLVMFISMIQIPFEIALNIALVFGLWGFPKLGIAGLGYGFAIVFYIASIIIFCYILFSKRIGHTFNLLQTSWKIHWPYLKQFASVSWPIALTNGLECGLFTVVMFLMAHIGTTELAANQILLQFLDITITFAFAMSQAATVRIGHMAGELNIAGVMRSAKVNLAISFIFMLCLSILYWTIPHSLIAIDLNENLTKNSPVIPQVVVFFAIIGVFQLFDSQRLVLQGILRGLKDTKIPMLISLFSFWILALPIALLFGFGFNWGGEGIWIGTTFAIAAGAILLYFRFFRFIKRVDLKKMIEI